MRITWTVMLRNAAGDVHVLKLPCYCEADARLAASRANRESTLRGLGIFYWADEYPAPETGANTWTSVVLRQDGRV